MTDLERIKLLSKRLKTKATKTSIEEIIDLDVFVEYENFNYTLNSRRNVVALRLHHLTIDEVVMNNIRELKDITFLRISNCKLKEIAKGDYLHKIEELCLDGNQISDLTPLRGLVNLKNLSMWSNRISDLTPLSTLVQLNSLNLGGNQLTDITVLSKLTNLKELYLWHNQLPDLTPLSNLSNLKYLFLSNNQITDLTPLSNLINLETLDLSDNQISDLTPLSNLINLEYLNLGDNQISDLTPLSILINLTNLCVDRNQSTDLNPLVKLINLSKLDLRYNKILEIPYWVCDLNGMSMNWDEYHHEGGVCLFGNPLDDALISIIKQGPVAQHSYFEELRLGYRFVYEAKLAMLGEGDVGKTVLTHRLTDPQYSLTSSKSTSGINIRDWYLETDNLENETRFHFTIWDFGGQKKYDIAHTYFITPRSIYLLMTDKRRNDDFTEFSRWLYVVQLYSEDSPVIMVQSKIDERADYMSIEPYKQHYPNIEENLVRISCHDERKDTIDDLKDAISKAIPKLPQCREKLPKTWMEVKETLQGLPPDKYYICKKEFLEICSSKGINKVTSMQVSKLLHNLGLIIHHQDDCTLSDLIIVKTDWCIDAAYSVIDDEAIIVRKGHFTKDDLARIWSDNKYAGKVNELIALMKYYRLCFELSNGRGWLIPILLPENRPEDCIIPNKCSIQIHYKYPKLIPPGLMASIIVESHQYLCGELYWRFGVVLEKNQTRAYILEDPLAQLLRVCIEGKHPAMMTSIVRDRIEAVHNRLTARSSLFEFEEWFPCICNVCSLSDKPNMYKSDELENMLDYGIEAVRCKENRFCEVSIKEILHCFEPIQQSEEICKRLFSISKTLQSATISLEMNASEDALNQFYFEKWQVFDSIQIQQTPKHGLSQTGKSAGLPDIALYKKEDLISIIEAFILSGWSADVAYKHWNKLFDYDVNGVAHNFHLVYVMSDKFSDLWKKYCKMLQSHKFIHELTSWNDRSHEFDASDIKVGTATHLREEKLILVTHIFIKITKPKKA